MKQSKISSWFSTSDVGSGGSASRHCGSPSQFHHHRSLPLPYCPSLLPAVLVLRNRCAFFALHLAFCHFFKVPLCRQWDALACFLFFGLFAACSSSGTILIGPQSACSAASFPLSLPFVGMFLCLCNFSCDSLHIHF